MKFRPFICRPDHDPRTTMALAWREVCQYLEKGLPAKVLVGLYEEKRTNAQNDKMWALLEDLSEQLPWEVNGQKVTLEPEEWKEIMTAGLRSNSRVARGAEGGFVVLGTSTSSMSKPKMSELIEFILYFGAQHDVEWTPAKERPTHAYR